MGRLRVRRGRLLLVLLAFIAIAGGIGYRALQWWDEPLAGLSAPVVIEVASGERVGTLSERLSTLGVLDHPTLWAWQARLRGQAGHLRTGEYEIKAHSTPRDVLALLVSGKVLLHPVTLVEGWTVREVLATLHAQPFLHRRLESASDPAIRTALGLSQASLEGQLYADTYLVPKGTTDLDVLKWAHGRLAKELSTAWAARDPHLPISSPYEALTLASIIEKETGNPDERARIAGVFVNRLRKGMRLQTDPTVIYGLGEQYRGVLHKKDLQTDTPWNTYTRDGLPPTPIALPGRAAIEAALHPAPTADLYFVASGKGDGRHTFSPTLAAHNAAVASYVASQRRRKDQGP